jgi:hypothetical protein
VEAKADVNAKGSGYDPPLLARLKMGAQVLFYFGRFNFLVLVVEGLRSNMPSLRTKATLLRICAASVRASHMIRRALPHAPPAICKRLEPLLFLRP